MLEEAFNSRLQNVDKMAYGPTRLAAAQDLVKAADLAGIRSQQIGSRDMLIETATFEGRYDISYNAFFYNISLEPDFTGRQRQAWNQFGWIMVDLPYCDVASIADIENVLSELDRLWQKFGWGDQRRVFHHASYAYARSAPVEKRVELAKLVLEDLAKIKSPKLFDLYQKYKVWMWAEDFEKATDAAEILFADGRTCTEIPHSTYGEVSVVYALRGDVGRAEELMNTGYEMCHDNQVLIVPMSSLILCACKLGKVGLASEWAHRHFHFTDTLATWTCINYLTACWIAWTLNKDEARDTIREELVSIVGLFDSKFGNDGRKRWVQSWCDEFGIDSPLT